MRRTLIKKSWNHSQDNPPYQSDQPEETEQKLHTGVLKPIYCKDLKSPSWKLYFLSAGVNFLKILYVYEFSGQFLKKSKKLRKLELTSRLFEWPGELHVLFGHPHKFKIW